MSIFDRAKTVGLFEGAAGADRKLFNIKPEEKLTGDEIAVDGTFDDAAGWTTSDSNTNWSITGGKAVCDGQQSAGVSIYRNMGVQTDKVVRVSFELSDVTAGTVGVVFYATSDTVKYVGENGKHVFYHTVGSGGSAHNGNIGFAASSSFVGKVDNLSIVEVSQKSSDFKFDRGSNITATRVNKDGLIEKGRENLALYSNTFNNSVWGTQGSGTTLTSGSTGYDGTSDAWQLTVSGESGNVNQSLTTTGVKTVSVYAKSVSGSGIRLYGNESGGSNHVSAFFALTGDGSVVGTPDNSITETITKVGNDGWYRCSVTFDKTLTKFYFYVTTGGSSNSTDGTVLIQDAQAERGLVATEYMHSEALAGLGGILEDEPRFDYTGGGCPKLLMEMGSTNIVKASEYFNHLHWGDLKLSEVADNDLISPEGVKNAVRIQANTTNGTHAVYTHVFGVTSGTKYTLSIFAKKTSNNNRIILTLTKANGTDIGFDEPVFNLEDGTITGDSSNAEMIEHEDGWWRCIVTSSPTASEDARLYTYICKPDGTKTYQPTDTSNEVYLYGAQWEAKPFATSYIPTHGTFDSRSMDNNIGDAIPAHSYDLNKSWSLFVDLGETKKDNGVGSQGFIDLETDSNAKRVSLYANASGVGEGLNLFLGTDNSGYVFGYANNDGLGEDSSSVCVSYDHTNYRLTYYINGDLYGYQATELSMGDSDSGGGQFRVNTGFLVNVKKYLFFEEALSDTEAVILTGTSYNSFGAMVDALTNYTTYE